MTEDTMPEETLSRREQQVAEAYADGSSYKEIADELGVAPGTIRTHLGAIYRKLNVSTKIELLRSLEQAVKKRGAPDGGLDEALTAPASPRPTDYTAAMRVTLAVLKPSTGGLDERSARFAGGLAKTLVLTLAKHPDIAVISRAASFSVTEDEDPIAAATRLRADYLLHSEIMLEDGAARASFELIDGETGRDAWAERLQRTGDTPLEIEDKLVMGVVNMLIGWNGELHRAQHKRIAMREPETLNAFEHFIAACAPVRLIDRAVTSYGLAHLDRALKLDPCFARCWLVKSVMLNWSHDIDPAQEPNLLEQSEEAIEMAYSLEPLDATALSLVALKRARHGDMAGAETAVARAAMTCESFCDACMTTATAQIMITGDIQAAGLLLDRAFALNPAPPGWYHFVEARIAFFLGDHDRVIRAAQGGAEHVSGLAYACLSHAAKGDSGAAVQAHASMMQVYPNFNFIRYRDDFPVIHPEARNRFDKAHDALMTVVNAG